MSVRRTLSTIALAVGIGLSPSLAHAQTFDEPVRIRCEWTGSIGSLLGCVIDCSRELDGRSVKMEDCERQADGSFECSCLRNT